MRLPRIGIVSDLREEQWHSMDLIAEMLLLHLDAPGLRMVEPTELRPSMARRLTRAPLVGRLRVAGTADRIVNRILDYPRWLAPRRDDFDLFHVVDHSYAHLVTDLPAGRTIVTCHDLDAFRGVLPGSRGGSTISRALGRRALVGLQAAARVVCVSQASADELRSYDVVDPARIAVIPNGVHPTCGSRPDYRADQEVCDLLGADVPGQVELLHVGSTIARKRIDALLETIAALRRVRPGVRLIRVGEAFTAAQERHVRRLGLEDAVAVLPFVDRRVLASLYRRATLLLQPSEREGFGLPVAEAMACGTPVVASRIAALVEVGGRAATFCPVGDVPAWVSAIADLLEERDRAPGDWHARGAAAMAQSRRFSWREHARRMTELYLELLPGAASSRASVPLAVAQ
jgi:glycosyltransferase involved in cell wall biosynthesis